MERRELEELHYITHIANVLSILQNGLMSHSLAKKLPHKSVAMEEIQTRRAPKIVPNGFPLHNYVNLYFNARNKMMYRIKDRHEELCVLRIDPKVLDIKGTVVSDRNAASGYARFYPSPDGLKELDRGLIFATYWNHDEVSETWRHGSIVCAEVLVPEKIAPDYILGAYFSCEETRRGLIALHVGINIQLKPSLFFR